MKFIFTLILCSRSNIKVFEKPCTLQTIGKLLTYLLVRAGVGVVNIRLMIYFTFITLLKINVEYAAASLVHDCDGPWRNIYMCICIYCLVEYNVYEKILQLVS